MDSSSFVSELKNGPEMNPNEDVFKNIWKQYEGVILQSLVTAFALDFLIRDQHGGDVDTIHNVRQIGTDKEMQYKNAANAMAYDNRGEYSREAYHSDPAYRKIIRDAKNSFNENGTTIQDAYVPGNTLIPKRNDTIPREHQAQLDHVISAKSIHDDRGRVLAGMDGMELANDPGNLRFTNANLNLNMLEKSPEEYIAWCEQNPELVNYNGNKGDPLPEEVKERLLDEYNRAKKEYDTKLMRNYLTSPGFIKDTAKAAAKTGAKMGLRQALGFVFVEIWLATKNELEKLPIGKKLEDMFRAVERGIKKGIENAKSKYKELIAKFKEGFIAGALSSVTTTICNFFFTTAKNIVRFIRQIYASVVQAAKVIFFNPDGLMLGDRIKTATIILATGASTLVGIAIGELVGKALATTPLAVHGELCTIVTTFCSTLVSGMLSCTLLLFLDRSKFINDLVTKLNNHVSHANDDSEYYKEMSEELERYASEIAELDIEKFRKETAEYGEAAKQLVDCDNDIELNEILHKTFERLDIKLPWQGDFNEFMSDKNNKLIFE